MKLKFTYGKKEDEQERKFLYVSKYPTLYCRHLNLHKFSYLFDFIIKILIKCFFHKFLV